MSADDLAHLETIVLADRELTRRLASSPTLSELTDALVDLAREHGLDVDADDVEAAAARGDRRRIERWI